ncbi:hypothetical protein [Lentibacillus amyloliquefaciens]|nr:hypothetical protein [Lentibacillus amyloliquefaciens]
MPTKFTTQEKGHYALPEAARIQQSATIDLTFVRVVELSQEWQK